jgi:hypothetical protein
MLFGWAFGWTLAEGMLDCSYVSYRAFRASKD